MTDTDRPMFTARLLALGELHGKTLSPALMALYFEALADLPTSNVLSAMGAAAQGQKWFPKPADIRDLVQGDPQAAEESAWMALRVAQQAVGAYTSLVMDDTALAETVRAMWGSWPAACLEELSPEMQTARRKEFGRVYQVWRGRKASGPRYLVGVCEQQNSTVGEWVRFVPVARLGVRGQVRRLSPEEANRAKEVLSAVSSELTRVGASAALDSAN